MDSMLTIYWMSISLKQVIIVNPVMRNTLTSWPYGEKGFPFHVHVSCDETEGTNWHKSSNFFPFLLRI